MIERNYSILLQKVRDKIMMWRFRTLTPSGKVQIMNSLLSSVFAYKLLCLPTPLENILKQYKEKIVKFLWAGYANKIPYFKAIQNLEIGGLKLADLQIKDKALKTSWVAKSSQENCTSPLSMVLPIHGKSVWSCNISPSDVKRLSPVQPNLAYQTWQYWAEIKVSHTRKHGRSKIELLGERID